MLQFYHMYGRFRMDKKILEYGVHAERRIRKTRIAVENALLELLKEKKLNQITISELAERADINRKTFYNNYSSIEEVLSSIESKLTAFIFDSLPRTLSPEVDNSILNLFQKFAFIVEPHKEILNQIAFQNNLIPFQKRMDEKILPYIEKNLVTHNIDKRLTPYINLYIVHGVFNVFTEWFSKESDLTADQIAQLAYNLTISAMKKENYERILE